MKVKVVDIGVISRWQGMVLTLEDWLIYDEESSLISCSDDHEDFRFSFFEASGFYYNQELHELVDV